MKLAQITPKTDKELATLITDTRVELAKVRLEARTKQVTNVKQIAALKKIIARAETIARERQIASQEADHE